MLTTDERHTATIPAPPSRPRLRLQPDLSARTLLDGGWWPRSAEPAAELPALILAIEERHGPITRIMLGRATQAGNRTPALLAAITATAIPGRPPAAIPAGTTPDSIQLNTWEWEDGQDDTRSRRAATSAAS